jgi:hypothetical protein
MPTPTATELIERVKARYAGCRSYEDTGEQVSVTVHGNAPWHRKTERKKFHTAYQRPDNYFFDSCEVEVGPESEWPRIVVWANSRGASSWEISKYMAGRDPERSSGTLQQVTGPGAHWASTMIPKLLIPSLTYRGLPDVKSVSLQGVGTKDGVECYRLLTARDRTGDPMVFWIECDSCLIRRIDERMNMTSSVVREIHDHMLARLEDLPPQMRDSVFQEARERGRKPHDDYFVDTTTTWRPRMDHDIDPKVFEFTPPG